MPKQNADRSRSRIIRMPKLHDETEPAEIWFEAGMIYFQDPRDRNEVASCTLAHFRAYVDLFCKYADDEEMIKQFVCGRQALRRFVRDAMDMIREVEPQLHVGLSIGVISEVEAGRAGVTRKQGFDPTASQVEPEPCGTTFRQRDSGLIVPG